MIYLLALVFALNTIFGYPYSNITIGIFPLNELILLLSIIYIGIKRGKLFIPGIAKILLILSLIIIVRSIFDYFKYGIWAFRDVMHFIEVFWIIPASYIFKKYREKFLDTLYYFLFFFLLIKVIFFLSPYRDLTIPGFQGPVKVFTSKASIPFGVIYVSFYSIFFSRKRVLILVGLFIYLIFLVFLQSRNFYFFSILTLLIILFITSNPKRFFIKLILTIIFALIFLEIISHFTFLNSYTRFGVEAVSPLNILDHLLSSFGIIKNPEFSSAAAGVFQRLDWWTSTINKWSQDLLTILLGIGYGIPLTDFFVEGGRLVREPHNSYLSILARGGIVVFMIWFLTISFILYKYWIYLKNYVKITKKYPKSILCFFIWIYMLLTAFSEPSFELPFEATIAYICLVALILRLK